MLPSNYRKHALAALMASLLLSGCSGNDTGEDLARVQANLDLAEVYRDQGQFRASIIEASNALQLMPDNVAAKLLLSDLYLRIGDASAAIDSLNDVRSLDPANVEAGLALAEAYLLTGRLDEARELLESTDASGEQAVRKNRLLGNLHAAEGDMATALAALQDNLQAAPSDIDTLISLSKIEYQSGNLEAAQGYLDQAIQVGDSEHVDLWIWRGQFAMLQENYPEAENAFFEALDLMSLYDIMTSRRFMTLQSILVPLQMQGKDSEALRYSEIIASSPQGELMNRFAAATTLFEQGSIEAAQVELENLLALAPEHAQSNILLGVAQFQQGNFQEAESLLSRFADSPSATPQVVKTLAATHLRLNKPDSALSVLSQAEANYPEDASLPAMRALILQSSGDTDTARTVIEEGLVDHPDSPELLYALAGVQARLENVEGAVANLQRALEINPAFQDAKTALLNIRFLQNDMTGAEALTEQWIQAEPEVVFNHFAAALVNERQQDIGGARGHYERIVQIDPENARAPLNLVRLHLLEQDFDGAISRLNGLIQEDIGNANALAMLLVAHEQAGSREAGIQRFQELMSENPEAFTPPLVLAQYHAAKGELEQAIVQGDKALAIENDPAIEAFALNARLQLANRELSSQNPAAARRYLQDALAIQPAAPAILAMAARLEAQEGNQTAADEYLVRLQNAQPDAPLSLEVAGDLAGIRDNPEEALAAYRQAWDAQPASGVAAKLYQLLGSMDRAQEASSFLAEEWKMQLPQDPAASLFQALELQSSNRNDEAIQEYETAFARLPNNLLVLNNLAWLYQDSNPERALELARRGAELYSENAQVLDTLGWVLFKQNQREEAIQVLERASELAPGSAEIQAHLQEARQ